MPRAWTRRSTWVSGGTSTTMTRSNPALLRPSASSGMSCTTIGPGGGAALTAARSSSAIPRRTGGWTISFSLGRRPGSAKTIWPSRSRFSVPSGPRTSWPKARTSRLSPGVPGSTTARAAMSASMSTAPRAASRLDTSLLPDPMPPVSPTRSTATTFLQGPNAKAAPTGVGAASDMPLVLAAAELLAQGCQRLVRGKGASGGGTRGRGRGNRALPADPGAGAPLAPRGAVGRGVTGLGRDRVLLVGLSAGLLDLLAVRFEAGAGLGVLVLPLLTLLLVARQPLPGLRVETLGVLVVALLVVGGRHAIQGRVEVVADGLADRALVGLLERQADPAPGQVEVDDLYEDLVDPLDDPLGNL